MCTVGAAAVGGLQIASQVAGAASQSKAAKDQANFQNRRYRGVADSALDSYVQGINSLASQSEQDTAATGNQVQDVQDQVAKAQGTTKVRAAASGIAGNTVDDMLGEFSAIEAENEHALNTNLQWRELQRKSQAKGLAADTASRIAGAAPQKVNGPDPLAFALGIGGSVLGGFNMASEQLKDTPNQPSYSKWFAQPLEIK